MRRALLLLLIAVACFPLAILAGSNPATEPDLVFEPIIRKAQYCGGKPGVITLRMLVELRSDQASQVPLVLPLFSQVSGYNLFRDEAAAKANRPESAASYRLKDVLDASKLTTVKPDPKLFRLVQAGQTASFYGLVEIPVVPMNRKTPPLFGMDRYLRIRIKPWPAARKESGRLRRLWRSQGLLWTREVVSAPIKIHFEQAPKPEACWMQID